ncbi:NPCBM/NEW2 domain-containing protein [Chitinophaga niabensis]|uniref:Metallo-peptidase family M12B Reprolysin-like n=1 Tax=Chitinophaga niabensis TaxID=536979 RepID=A0A1N6FK09_9BACT|nr:NPCBM/NEW2 domain-containing protein [Chitinophaga niabensis]SIN95566.1 Metallo-peptidase family M12B Reprolysin-like [Chitinophaga niabensis]
MKFPTISLLFVSLAANCFGQISQVSKDAITASEKVIKAYHAGTAPSNKVVKVVYFHGYQAQPLPNWEERLNRTLHDVSKYYQEEFSKSGIQSNGVPFEKSGDKYVITVVEGNFRSGDYDINAGQRIGEEIARKTAGKVNFSTDHVLIFTGLSYKKEDSTYVFHSPYWGTGSSQKGVCFVADCDLLDSKLLTDTAQRIKFSEQAIAFKECSVAEFNSWYIGGIAHEMGHMFGLPHDNGNPSELAAKEISLMGQYGSRHFRGYLWGDRKSSVISAAGIMQLLSHPVFTQSVTSANNGPESANDTLHFENNDKGVTIRSAFPTGTLPYACYTLLRTVDITEYFNKSSIHTIGPANQLNMQFGKLPGGMYLLSVVLIYPNGAIKTDQQIFTVNSDGIAAAPQLLITPYVNIKAFHNRLLKEEKSKETALKLKILEPLVHPTSPADPLTAPGKRLYLSDTKWEKAEVGWQEPARNYYSRESERTFFLENQGKIYEKGLFAHAPSVYSFKLGKKWRTFSALAAFRDDLREEGSVRFTIWGDGKLLYTSPVLTTGQQTPVKIAIAQVDILELKAESTAPDNNGHCWSIWLNPVIER